MKKKHKQISFNINTTTDFLAQERLTLDDIKADVEYLGELFGTKYLDMFPADIATQDILFIKYCVEILKAISGCAGFNSHLAQYNAKEIKSHLFTARVARYLLGRGYKVALEPDMGRKDGPHPDLRVEKDGTTLFAECKTSDISNFYGRTQKKQIADIVNEKIQTCDQIDVFFHGKVDVARIQELFKDETLVQKIYGSYERGKDGKENRIVVDDLLEINVIQKPPIIGAEDDFLTAEMGGYLEDIVSGVRSIGFAFMRGGRSIGVYDVANYENKWKDKRENSQKQLVEGCPNIVFIDGSDVVGNPSLHRDYFDKVWLTEELPDCNGVVILHQYQKLGSSALEERVDVYENPHAIQKITFNGL